MFTHMTTWLRLANDRRAVTAIEYGLIASLVALAIITAVALVGTDLGNTFTSITNHL